MLGFIFLRASSFFPQYIFSCLHNNLIKKFKIRYSISRKHVNVFHVNFTTPPLFQARSSNPKLKHPTPQPRISENNCANVSFYISCLLSVYFLDAKGHCSPFIWYFKGLVTQVEFITAPTPRPPGRSPLSAQLQCRGGFSVLTLFILALVKMWCFGFLSPGFGGCCGEEIGACGRPPPPLG